MKEISFHGVANLRKKPGITYLCIQFLIFFIEMRILLSNDDGYSARGLKVLARIMSQFGDLTVVAPKYHQSAMSMAVSLGMKKLVYKPLPEEGPGNWHYLDATPASCVKFGLEYFYENRNPDLVVCGINHGSNAATAANYSATIGATEEGALNGCKAIGVSLCNFSSEADFTAVERRLPVIIRTLLDNWPEGKYGLLYNINFPDLPDEQIKGVKFTRQGKGHWVREFQEWDDERLKAYAPNGFFKYSGGAPLEEGEKAYMMIGDFVDDDPGADDADHVLIEDGWIAVTPNNLDRTDYEDLRRLRSIVKDL